MAPTSDVDHRELINRLSEDVQENAVTLARISAEIDQIARTVTSLATVVRDGNGNSLITRLVLVETRLKDLELTITTITNKMDSFSSEKIKGSYNIAFGLLTGVLGIIGAVLGLWLQGSLKLGF